MLVGLWLTAFLPVFVVIIDGRTLEPSVLQTIVASCDEVLAEERCIAGDASDFEQDPAGRNQWVVLHGDAAFTTVVITLPRAEKPALSRELHLDPSATPDERARAAGLVVAAQVLALRYEGHATTSAPGATPQKAETLEDTWHLDLAASLGTALDRGPPRVGLVVRGSWLPLSIPLGVTLAVRGAYRPDTPHMLWAAASLGLMLRYAPSMQRVAVEGRLEAVGQRTELFGSDAGAHERVSALRWGGQLGVDLLLRLTGSMWLLVGAEGTLLVPRLDLYDHGSYVGAESPGNLSLLLGIRKAW